MKALIERSPFVFQRNTAIPRLHTLRSDASYLSAADLSLDTRGITPTFSRNCVAYRDYWDGEERKLVEVAANVPRWCQRKDQAGNLKWGLLVEPDRTNTVWASRNMPAWWTSNMTWVTHSDGGPFGTYWGASDTDNTSKNRYVSWYSYPLPTGTRCTWAIAKKGAWNYVILRHTGSSQWSKCFNLNTGTVGTWTQNEPLDKGIINFGGGWYLIYIVVAETGSAISACDVFPVAADGPNGAYTGAAGTERFYLAAAQSELGNFPGSIIATPSGGVATCYGDSLCWNVTGKIRRRGSLVYSILLDNRDQISDVFCAQLHGGASNKRISSAILAAGDAVYSAVINGSLQGSITGAADIVDGNRHTISVSWTENKLYTHVDDALVGSADLASGIPPDITTLELAYNGGLYQSGALISDVKLYDRPGVMS